MSLGSRILQRGRIALSANAVSTPREPLLFLYPRWSKKSSTTVSREDERLVGWQAVRIGEREKLRSSGKDNGVSLGDTTSSTAISRQDETLVGWQPVPIAEEETYVRIAEVKTLNNSLMDKGVNLGDAKPPTAVSRHDETLVGWQRIAKETYVRIAEDKAFNNNLMDNGVNLGDTKSRTAVSREDEALVGWQPLGTVQVEYMEEQRRAQLQPDPSILWNEVFTELVKHTPQHGEWLNKAVEIAIPWESLRRTPFEIDDSIWEIGQQYGVSVDTAPLDGDRKQYRRFVISGPRDAITTATEHMSQIAPGLEIKFLTSGTDEVDVEKSSSEETSITASDLEMEGIQVPITYYATNPIPPKLKIPATKIQKPKEWTHKSLLFYVRILTRSSPPNHGDNAGLAMDKLHHTSVIYILWSLLQDLTCRPFISRMAYHEMMKYFIKASQIEKVKELLVYMEGSKIAMNAETFNIMMSGAASSNDLHGFQTALQLMLQRGFAPNGRTWMSFLTISLTIKAKKLQAKQRIVAAMNEKRLTSHPQIMSRLMRMLLEHEIDSALDLKLGIHEFVAHVDNRYGKNWFSNFTANSILRHLVVRRQIPLCVEFLQFMESRRVKPTMHHINIMIERCADASRIAGAVELLQTLPSNMTFVPDHYTYNTFFHVALQTRRYNLARVIWRYACLSATTSARMRTTLRESMRLTRQRLWNPKTGNLQTADWEHFAGPIVFGANYNGEHPGQILEKLNPGENIPASEISLDKPLEFSFEAVHTGYTDGETARTDLGEPDASETDASSPHSASYEGSVKGYESLRSPFEGADTETTDPATSKVGCAVPEAIETQASKSQLTEPDTASSSSTPAKITQNPSHQESHTPLLEHKPKQRLSLHDFLAYDTDMYEEWEPVRPFLDMVSEAFEKDLKWKALYNNGVVVYADTLAQEAISVPVRLKEEEKRLLLGLEEVAWR